METVVLSSLEKVFSNEKPVCRELKKFSMLKNERSCFQIAFCLNNDGEISIEAQGDLADCLKIFLVKEIPVGTACQKENADDFYLRKESGNYPDCLVPVEKKLFFCAKKWNSFWIEVAPNEKISGKTELAVKIIGEETVCKKIEIEVIDAKLPKNDLVYTNWYHSDCLCNFYKTEPFCDEYWRINKNFIKKAAEHGMNCILTPLFTPPLDTMVGGERKTIQLVTVYRSSGKYSFDFSNLKKWIDVCRECGIEYFEMSHFFTQWGAKHAPKIVAVNRFGIKKKIFGWKTRTSSKKYDEFLRCFASELVKFLEKENIKEKCFFHVSDEPGAKDIETYKRRSSLIKEIFPDFKVIDALSDFDFYQKGIVKNPIPCEDGIKPFIGAVPELWTYYCCGQGHSYLPNRFISMPSLRNRILGLLVYKYEIRGFLHWGYNFYNTQYSIRAINPFKITDAGGAFPSGDSFIVYPGKNGTALESLRLKVFYDALQDLAALNLLESKIGREKVIELIENGLPNPLTFNEYPHENEWLLELREKINAKIKEIS